MIKSLIHRGISSIFSLFILAGPFTLPSAYSFKLKSESFETSQDFVSVKLEFDSVDEFIKNFENGYNLKVKFDKTKLKYEKCNFEGSLSNKTVKIDKSNKNLSINLDSNCDLSSFQGPQTIELLFKSKNKDEKCETPILVSRVKENPIKLLDIPLKGNPNASTCRLASLIPSSGNLSPKFDPEVFEYNLTVEHNVKSINFDFTPLTEGLKVKINRKKLHGPGEHTDILVTVSNHKLKIKKIYKVHVYRKEKATEAKPKAPNKNKSRDKNSEIEFSSEPEDHSLKETPTEKVCIPDKNLAKLEDAKEFLSELENTNFPNHSIETETLDENNNFRIYFAIALLIFALALGAYLILKNVRVNKRNKNSNLQ